MPRPFPRPKNTEAPTGGSAEELLTDIPEMSQGGVLEGYARGRRVRMVVFGALVVGIIAAVLAARWYIKKVEAEEQRAVVPHYVVDDTHRNTATREFRWDDGPARLALAREAPGINLIILPDRVVRLAEGHDSAQIKLNVKNGRTVMLKVLAGRIDQTRMAR